MKQRSHIVNLPSELKTRQEAREFLSKLEQLGKKDSLVFDFAQVQFVGRSFADEFYNLFLKEQSKKIKIVNQSDEIRIIFQTVQSTQHKEKKTECKNPVKEFSNIDDLSAFLSTL